VVELNIYEPPRFFERLLRGREVREVPDIVARICGICPVAYQVTACQALESALGIVVGPEIRLLRRLLACGEWLQSHALHIHMLHAPDFLGCDSCFTYPEAYAGLLDRGLRMKAIGSRIIQVLGGRSFPILSGACRPHSKRSLRSANSRSRTSRSPMSACRCGLPRATR
jgi:coenzyme F420-reducing hydrogenase alpha subunit